MNIFPNVTTEGSYDAFSHVINLNSVERKNFDVAIDRFRKLTLSTEDIRILKVLIHEFRHYLDHISTLRGQELLIKQFYAIDAKLANNEYNLYHIKNYMNLLKSASLDNYFFTINQPDHALRSRESRWIWQLSSGYRFDGNGKLDESKSIFFINFLDKQKEKICRVPLTLSSLFELCATSEEFFFDQIYFSTLGENERLVELASQNASSLSKLYTPELVLYSAAVHLYANILGISDTVKAYTEASRLIYFILNLPDEYLKRVPISIDLRIFGNRNRNMHKDSDIGYIYYNILILLSKIPTDNFDKKIEELLKMLGFPNIKDLEITILEKMYNNLNVIGNSFISEYFKLLIQNGIEYFKVLGLSRSENTMVAFNSVNRTTYILFGDDLEVQDPLYKEWCEKARYFYKALNEFDIICGV